jgi:hypothetical protein
MFDGSYEGSACLWHRSHARLCSPMHYRNHLASGFSPSPGNGCAAGQRPAPLARASLRLPHAVGRVAAPPHSHTRPGPLAARQSAPATGEAGCAPSSGAASLRAGPDRGDNPGGCSGRRSTAGPPDRHTPARRSTPGPAGTGPAAAPNRPCIGRERRRHRSGLATLGAAGWGHGAC